MKTLILLSILFSLPLKSEVGSKPHATWDAWLKSHVTVTGPVSTVDYKKTKADRSGLDAYLKEVTAVTKPQFDAYSENEKLAFLINAYNAFTIDLITTNYPVKSIKDLGSLFKSPWKKNFFKLFGEEQNLDGIEHGMIRKMFQEPRIHMSVVCASKGCPALRNEAFVASDLERQFSEATRMYLGDTSRNRYDPKENKLYLSLIFKWYGDDFKKKAGTVQEFVAPFLSQADWDLEKLKKADIEWLDYDWSLNEQQPGV